MANKKKTTILMELITRNLIRKHMLLLFLYI